MIASLDSGHSLEHLKIGSNLRNAGINTEVYLDDKNIGTQMRYANKKGVKYVVMMGEEEFSNGTFILRNMDTGDQETYKLLDIVEELRKRT